MNTNFIIKIVTLSSGGGESGNFPLLWCVRLHHGLYLRINGWFSELGTCWNVGMSSQCHSQSQSVRQMLPLSAVQCEGEVR